MIIFQNLGLIDMMAVKTMGVNVKVQPGAFGQFGTGLKFSIATILRGGGSIVIYRGLKAHRFTVQPTKIRGETFDIVCLDGVDIGFTTQLGANWEPWMVLRELGCNALDEAGQFWLATDENCRRTKRAKYTTIVVEWDALDGAYAMREKLFLEGEPFYNDTHIRVLPGTSQYVYYRGIRAYKLDKPSVHTYDVLDAQTLTEDRTLASIYAVNTRIAVAILAMTNEQAIRDVITCGEGYHEARVDLADRDWIKPTKEFLTTVASAREAGQKVLDSAIKVLRRYMRRTASSRVVESFTEKYRDRLQFTLDSLANVGITFAEKQNIVEVPGEHMGDVMSSVEEGIIYISRDLVSDGDPLVIAGELIKRWVDLKQVWSADDAVALLSPILIQNIDAFKRFQIVEKTLLADEQEEPEEEERRHSVADALLTSMDVRGEEYPARPSEMLPDLPFGD
jgi:hypothetical protein